MTGRRSAVLTLCVVLSALAPGAQADHDGASCPPAPDHSAALDGLFAQLKSAPNALAAMKITNRMWGFWADAPDAYAQQLLDEGMTRRTAYDFAGAVDAFHALVSHCPDYAEGYNQRAFVNFIRQDYTAALPDLQRAVALSPRHLGALSGLALTLVALQRTDEAARVLRRAVELNPWLRERHLSPKIGGPEDGGDAPPPAGAAEGPKTQDI